MTNIVIGGSTFAVDKTATPDQFENGVVVRVASLWKINAGDVSCEDLTFGLSIDQLAKMSRARTYMHIASSMGIFRHFPAAIHQVFTKAVRMVEKDLEGKVTIGDVPDTTSSPLIYQYSRRSGTSPETYYVGFCPYEPEVRLARLLSAFPTTDKILSADTHGFLEKIRETTKKAKICMNRTIKLDPDNLKGFKTCEEFVAGITSSEGIACGASLERGIRDITNLFLGLI